MVVLGVIDDIIIIIGRRGSCHHRKYLGEKPENAPCILCRWASTCGRFRAACLLDASSAWEEQEKKVGRECPSKSASVSLHHVRLYVCLSGHACMCVLCVLSVCTSVCMGMQADSERESLLVCVCMYNTRVPIAVVEFAVGEDVHALPMELVVLELP